jgi:hypothetical protein
MKSARKKYLGKFGQSENSRRKFCLRAVSAFIIFSLLAQEIVFAYAPAQLFGFSAVKEFFGVYIAESFWVSKIYAQAAGGNGGPANNPFGSVIGGVPTGTPLGPDGKPLNQGTPN